MIKRIVSAVLLIPIVAFVIIYKNTIVFNLVLTITGIMLAMEIIFLSKNKIDVYVIVVTALSVALIILYRHFKFFNLDYYKFVLLVTSVNVFGSGFFYIFDKDFERCLHNTSISLFAVTTAGIFLSTLYEIRINYSLGAYYIYYLLASVWLYDAGGYFFGKKWGKIKLGLNASPKKSWAGLFGGIVLAVVGVLVLVYFTDKYIVALNSDNFFSNKIRLSILTIIISLLAQMGDLFESVMKRSAGKKDSGSIIPGHGGIYDAIDGIIPTAVFLFFILKFIK